MLRDVKAELMFWRYSDGVWTNTTQVKEEEGGGLGVGQDVHVSAVWPNDSNDLWLIRSGYLVPQTMEICSAEDGCSKVEQLRSMPHMFDAKGLIVKQHFATSADGTKVTYTHSIYVNIYVCVDVVDFIGFFVYIKNLSLYLKVNNLFSVSFFIFIPFSPHSSSLPLSLSCVLLQH